MKEEMLKSRAARTVETVFLYSWWMIIFFALCCIFYKQGQVVREQLYTQMSNQFDLLQKEKKQALLLQEKLKRQLNSQSDPSWVELSLIKELGVVPEGQIKIYFSENYEYPEKS